MTTGYLGLMSGTSLDGVDGVWADWPAGNPTPTVAAHVHRPFAPALRAELLALNQRGGPDELHRAMVAANGVADAYAEVVQALRDHPATRGRAAPRAVGAHGQTVRHAPDPADGSYTVQLLNAARLAEACGLDVVADLRSRDVAAGGQGAPLVPAFHAQVFGDPREARAVLNLGGIGNLTLLRPTGDGGLDVQGFDCGPANLLLDGWCERHTGQPFDRDGAWAASTPMDPGLLAELSSDPFFELPPPKSTGRDRFHPAWLDDRLAAARAQGLPAATVQSTLAELTAWAATQPLREDSDAVAALYVCGGGAFNGDLMRRLQARLPRVRVQDTQALGLPPDQVEACAFAWLAKAFIEGAAGNLPQVTGAKGWRRLGALHPGA